MHYYCALLCILCIITVTEEANDKLNINSITNSKLFWETICQLFSGKKLSGSSKIILLDKSEIVSDDAKIAETFNTFFSNITKTLNIEYQSNQKSTRSKTRKPRKSWKSRKCFSEIFESEFSILAVGQYRKLGNKKTRKNISEISEVSEFSICHFFIFQKTFFFQYSRQFCTLHLRYVLFSNPLSVFASPKYMFKILLCRNKICLL